MREERAWLHRAEAAVEQLRAALGQPSRVARSLHVGLEDAAHPVWWLRAAPVNRARAMFGSQRVGLGTVWKVDAPWPCLDLPRSPWGAAWVSLPFDVATRPQPPWTAFGGLRLWTPRLEWQAAAGLTLRTGPGLREWQRSHALLASLAQRLQHWPPSRPGVSLALPECLPGDRRQWARQLGRALKDMRPGAGSLHKVVLVRSVSLPKPPALDPVTLFEALLGGEPTGWPYFLAWPRGGAWLGVTPEDLFHRRGRRLGTMALAGTRPRGASPAEDRALARELLHSEKEGREQAVVAEWLRERLESLCEGPVKVGARGLRRLGHVQHLQSHLTARLRKDVGDGQLLAALHPTPALCGQPAARALQWIRQHEDHGRGLHGGVMGLFSAEGSHCCVTIRGALVGARQILMQAGVGLVPGSVAQDEWAESSHKLEALLRTWRVR